MKFIKYRATLNYQTIIFRQQIKDIFFKQILKSSPKSIK